MDKVYQYTRGMSNGFFIFGEKLAAVDTGCIESDEAFLSACAEANVKPEDVSLIIITHGHVDHFFNLPAMKRLTGAPVMSHRLSANFINNGLDPVVEGRTAQGKAIIAKQAEEGNPTDHTPSSHVDIELDGDTDLAPWGVPGKMIMTPGHSPSCMSIVLEGGEAIVGDLVLATPPDGTPGLAFLSYAGPSTSPELHASLHRLLDANVTKFYSGHGGPFSREQVEALLAADEKAYAEGTL